MNQYYLISQLPSLDAVTESSPLPIGEDRFNELCSRFLSKKALNQLSSITLIPDLKEAKTGSALIDAWNEGEVFLRLCLGAARAEKLGKSFDTHTAPFPPTLLQAVHTASEVNNPLKAEQILNDYRLNFLETLRPSDAFCEDMVFYYCLKLKLLSRIKGFNEEKGQFIYKKIYSSILSAEEQEA